MANIEYFKAYPLSLPRVEEVPYDVLIIEPNAFNIFTLLIFKSPLL